MVGLTHSTCDRNETINSEDATKKLDATIYRAVGWADGLARNLIEQSDEADAKLECDSDGIVGLRGTWQVGR